MRSTSLRYMPGLDGLRAVAVAIVFVWHCFPGTVEGVVGVDIFFVLSGFLITSILVGDLDERGGIRLGRFYASRLLRLWPPLMVLVIAVLALGPFEHQDAKQILGDAFISLIYLSNLFKTLTSHPMAALGHTWSLAMEEQFYLLWPGALLWMTGRAWSRTKIATIATALAAASLLGWLLFVNHLGQFDPLIQGPGALLLGCALALTARDGHHWLDAPWLAWLGLLGAVAACAAQVSGVFDLAVSALVTVCIVPVVAHVAFRDSWLVRVLAFRPLVFLGVISYEIYLTHFPILYVFQLNVHASKWPIAGLTLVGTLIASVAMHYGVTRPVLRWRRTHLADRPVAAVPSAAEPSATQIPTP